MNIGDINKAITMYANADINQYPNADRVLFINRWYEKIIDMIEESRDGWDYDDDSYANYPIATRDLVANQQDYRFSTALWNVQGVEGGGAGSNSAIVPLDIKRVEISFDGTKFYKAFPMDINEDSNATDATTINQDFDQGRPFYDLAYNAIKLYPIPDAAVTAGLKVWFTRKPSLFTLAQLNTGTKEPQFDSQFHNMLALGAAYEFSIMKGRTNSAILKQELLEEEQRLKQHYGRKNEDRLYVMKAADQNYS